MKKKDKAVPILIGAGIAAVLFATAVLAKKPAPPPKYSVSISNINIKEV